MNDKAWTSQIFQFGMPQYWYMMANVLSLKLYWEILGMPHVETQGLENKKESKQKN